MQSLIHHLVTQQKMAAPAQLAQIVEHVGAAPFASDPLEVDEALWGSFWQFDVIAPGYTLPADELALLRAVRLDRTWPEDTGPAQFLNDLHRTISHPHAGIWSLEVIDLPCLVFVGQQSRSPATVVWYCAATGRLHAGYRTEIESLRFGPALQQRAPKFLKPQKKSESIQPEWLVEAVAQVDQRQMTTLAARLDAEILRLRVQMRRDK